MNIIYYLFALLGAALLQKQLHFPFNILNVNMVKNKYEWHILILCEYLFGFTF